VALADVAGVFSRYFIVGFFLPSFFGLVALSQTLTDSFLPAVYTDAGDGARIAIVGGAALLVGLVLLGLNHPITRWFEGYPLKSHGERWYAKHLCGRLMRRQQAKFTEMRQACVSAGATDVERRTAVWRMDQAFPRDNEDLLLPTSFGNAVRAFERHSYIRWGLNGIAVWPRIEMLLPTEETQVHADARGEVAFFVNGSLLAAIAGLVLVADELVNQPLPVYAAPLYAVPFIVGMAFYAASIGSAVRWGSAVRASIDIHRRELYEKLGLRTPLDFTDERETVAPAANGALLRGETIPDALSATPASADDDSLPRASINLGGLSLRLENATKGEPT
jgi:hypothetical protein